MRRGELSVRAGERIPARVLLDLESRENFSPVLLPLPLDASAPPHPDDNYSYSQEDAAGSASCDGRDRDG